MASLPTPRHSNGDEEKGEVQQSLSDEVNGDHVHLVVDPERVMQLEEMRKKETEAEGGLTGCREAVEILTRNPKKGKVVCPLG